MMGIPQTILDVQVLIHTCLKDKMYNQQSQLGLALETLALKILARDWLNLTECSCGQEVLHFENKLPHGFINFKNVKYFYVAINDIHWI